ncbi:MAG: hypothetical protein ABEJ40_08240 [Haloarculaceae archaeon]
MAPGESDPSVIRTLAVTAGDVVAALEARRQGTREAVLRATPPFSGRMRARLHVGDGHPSVRTVRVEPAGLVASDAPAYPRPDETAAALRSDPDAEYSVERHHDRHREAVASWRETVRDHFVDETTVETPGGDRTVDVVVLG